VVLAADFDADFDALFEAPLVADVARFVTVFVAPTAGGRRPGGRAGRGAPAGGGRLRQLARVGDDLLERRARVELRHRRLLDLHRVTGPRVAAGASPARDLLEGAEPGDADLPAASDLTDDHVEDSLQRVAGGLLAPEL
jgi:hypothetical protein